MQKLSRLIDDISSNWGERVKNKRPIIIGFLPDFLEFLEFSRINGWLSQQKNFKRLALLLSSGDQNWYFEKGIKAPHKFRGKKKQPLPLRIFSRDRHSREWPIDDLKNFPALRNKI
ncbi:hypothetical protein EBU99_12005 [bacterium]|nr:hypothetical protein [bacterium]